MTHDIAALLDIMRRLRDPKDGCPWDREQDFASIAPYTIEEAYEVAGAIEDRNWPELKDELGDLLFQVVFHATIAAESGAFTLADVARGIHDKLVYRHPHVFAEVDVDGTDDVIRNWEQLKKAEKGRTSVMDGIPGDLPALLYAHKVLRKASSLGVETTPAEGIADGAALGDLLLSIVDAARRAELDPEAALRAAAARVREEAVARESQA